VRVALTFDVEHPDRPNHAPDSLERMLDALAEHHARATFFLQGRWVEAHPRGAGRIAEAGHLVGNHSFYHARMPLLTDEGIEADVLAAERAIEEAIGTNPRPWFRCPFGTGWDDARVQGLVGQHGYRHIGWDVEPRDWDPARTDAQVEDAIVAACETKDEAIVLLHGWPAQAAAALPGTLDRLRSAGATLVTVDELADPTRGLPAE
jgi:peptidoglycan-N-acetylglucosamine deacetylase